MPRYSVNPAPSDSLARGQPEDAGYKPDALHIRYSVLRDRVVVASQAPVSCRGQ